MVNKIEKEEIDYFEKLSQERKSLQESGDIPDWFITQAWQLFKQKYSWEGASVTETYKRIASTLAKHAKTKPDWWDSNKTWEDAFFEVLNKGYLAASTPVLSNTGTNKGCPVSCSGQYVDDSIYGFYESRLETAILTKQGFGTSGYLGDIRPRGTDINSGGKASGVLPVFKMFVQDMRDVAQGTSRRGSWAGYLPIDHDDFWEVINYIYNNPDDANIGFCYSNEFIDRLNNGDEEAISRYQRHMKLRSVTGKGYFFFTDKVNNANPQMYKDLGLDVKAAQLCNEVMLHSSDDLTYTCVLSSMNLAKYNEWKDTDAIFVSTVFLDCVAEEFIQLAENIKGLEKAVEFTKLGRPIGLGCLGFATYLQQEMIDFESFEAHMVNNLIFKQLHDESLKASQWMAKEWGEPEWCKGYGVRMTHRTAIAPNTSSALLCGGVSQGIEPIVANVYTQNSAGGEMDRINPVLLKLLKEKDVDIEQVTKSIGENKGSVQHLDFLSEQEKKVFKTAYEINQKSIVRLASARQRFICQGQSLNLFFSADEDEEWISEVTKEAILDPYIKGLYYQRGLAGVTGSKGECVACEG